MNVHDYIIFHYCVYCDKHTIILYTESENDPKNYIDIVFTGVLSHNFINVLEKNIIERIVETNIIELYNKDESFHQFNSYLFSKTNNDAKLLNEYYNNNSYKCFEINSSYGLNGWIVAKDILYKISDKMHISV